MATVSLPESVFHPVHSHNLSSCKTLQMYTESSQFSLHKPGIRHKYSRRFSRVHNVDNLVSVSGKDKHLLSQQETRIIFSGSMTTIGDYSKTSEIHIPFRCYVASPIICKNSGTEVRTPCRGSKKSIDRCINSSPQGPRRVLSTIAAATADSDQTFPSQNEGGEKVIPRKPSPEVEPADVVEAQLKALRERDVATVFEFASPKNKAYTGPLSRFTEMIQGRAYNVMIGHASANVLSSLFISPSRFQQRILIKGANGSQATFSWSLSKQEEGLLQGCWMTDSVHRDD